MKLLVGISLLFLITQTTIAQVGYRQEGKASVYVSDFEGKTTASGERFSHKKATCSHVSIPFGALLKITNLENNLSAIVRVNDRGPFVPDRIIDVSQSVAERLGIEGKGCANVSIEVVDNNGHVSLKDEGVKQDTPKNSTIEKKEQVIEGKEIAQNVITKTDKTPELPKPLSSEIFDLNVAVAKLRGFSIQIGSYKELANVLRIAAEVQNSTKNNTKIQVSTINGERVYKLMVGSFNLRKDAEQLKAQMVKGYKDCFIVELKE